MDVTFRVENLLELLVSAADVWLDFAPIIKLLEFTILVSLNPEAILFHTSFRAMQLNDEL